jgi:cephalosporin-C deacetylase
MPFFDLSPADLQQFRPPRTEPTDFDAFWQDTLEHTRQHDLNPVFERYDSGLKLVDVYDVTFSGYGGQRIKAWYMRPANTDEPLPCMVEYIGYGGGRGYPHSWLAWAVAGYAYLVMDTRGQGSTWRQGHTPDAPDDANPFHPGFMTQGILSPQTYYYRRLYSDAVRALETAASRADVDGERIGVTGISQGGGLSIAAAALAPDMVNICMPDVPFLCLFRRAVGLTETKPYVEIVNYLKIHREKVDTVLNTLDYFDGVNLAPRIRASCLFSTALMDDICPPSTVFAAYNYVQASKEIEVYPFNQHEGGEDMHLLRKIRYAQAMWGG